MAQTKAKRIKMKGKKTRKKVNKKKALAQLAEQISKIDPHLASLITRHITPDNSLFPEGTLVLNREGTEIGRSTGKTRFCTLEGCTGIRLEVRWMDGKKTYHCTKGMKGIQSKLQIL